MKRYFIIETLEQLKAISDPLRIRLLTMLISQAATGKQLGDQLQIAASKIHYHLHELENNGFIKVEYTEEKNGIIQKFYRAIAIDYEVSEELLPSIQFDPSLIQEVMANQLRIALSRVYETSEQFFSIDPSGNHVNDQPLIHGIWEINAKREDLLAWHKKYMSVMHELSLLDSQYEIQNGDRRDENTGTEKCFFMTTVGFLSDVPQIPLDNASAEQADTQHVHHTKDDTTIKLEATPSDSRDES